MKNSICCHMFLENVKRDFSFFDKFVHVDLLNFPVNKDSRFFHDYIPIEYCIAEKTEK